jgi:hypothetical protein
LKPLPNEVLAIIIKINLTTNYQLLLNCNKVHRAVLDSVWAMKRKRDILARKVLTYKARANLHGGQLDYAVNFFKTYSPVVTWAAVRLMTTLAWLNNWHTRQCYFVLAYPQATI